MICEHVSCSDPAGDEGSMVLSGDPKGSMSERHCPVHALGPRYAALLAACGWPSREELRMFDLLNRDPPEDDD